MDIMLEGYQYSVAQSSSEFADVPLSLSPGLAERYARERFVHLPALITPDNAQKLLVCTQDVPSKRVQCGLEHVTWCEQSFEPGHPVYEFFERDQAVELATGLAGLRECRGLAVWASIYGVGEYINSHRDSSGSIQLLVCLQTPPGPINGGELIVDGARMFLRPGDATAFEATTLEHHTTPLMATVEEPSPRRVVLVGRYFLE